MPDDKFWRAIPTWALDRQRADDEADSWAAQKRSDIADQWAKLMRQDTAARLAEMGYDITGRHIDEVVPDPPAAAFDPTVSTDTRRLPPEGASLSDVQGGLPSPRLPTAGEMAGDAMGALSIPAQIGRAGFPVPGQDSGESPGQKIARQGLAGSNQGFEETLRLGTEMDPTGGYLAGAANTVARLGTDPLTTAGVGGRVPRVGGVLGGAAGAGVSAATGAGPVETAQNIESGANLGLLGGAGAEAIMPLARRVAGSPVVRDVVGRINEGAIGLSRAIEDAGLTPGLTTRIVGDIPGRPIQHSNFLRDEVLAPKDDPRPTGSSDPGLPNVKPVQQAHLGEVLPDGALLYHETSVSNARSLLHRVEAGPRSQTFWTSDNPDLALGQGGKGVMLEIDPTFVNGLKSTNPAKAFSDVTGGGAEYSISKSLPGAVQAIIVRNERQAAQLASDSLVARRFDFAAATPADGGGFRIQRKGRTLPSGDESKVLMGGLAGIDPEQDDEGNITGVGFDPTRAAIGLAAGSMLRKSKPLSDPVLRNLQQVIEAEPKRPVGGPDFFTRLRMQLTDRMAPLANYQELAQEAAKAKGSSLAPDEMAHYLNRRAPSPASEIRLQEGLQPAIQSVGDDLTNLDAYLILQDNIDVAAAQGNPNRQFANQLTAATSAAKLRVLEAELGPQRWAQIEKAAQAVWDFGKSLLQRKLDAGVITQELFNDLTQKYPRYVPTRILDHLTEREAQMGNGTSIGLRDTGLRNKTFEGSEKDRERPLASMVRYAYDAEARAMKNEAANAFIKDMDQLGMVGTTVKKVANDFAETRTHKPLVLFENGVKQTYAVPRDVWAAIQSEPTAVVPGINTAMAVFKMLATSRNPAFLAGNVAIDAPTYVIRTLAREGGNPLLLPGIVSDLFKGYAEAFQGLRSGTQGSANVRDFLREGGGQFGFFTRSEEAARQTLGDLAKTGAIQIKNGDDLRRVLTDIAKLKPVEAIGARLEMGPRVAAYRRALKQGKSVPEAVIAGRTVTMDFAQGGTLTKTLNQFIPFFNVGVQGALTPFRLAKENPRGAALTAATMLVGPTLGAEVWNRADPQRAADYDDVPTWVKNQGIVVMLPTTAPTNEIGEREPQYFLLRLREYAPIVIATREITNIVMKRYGQDGWDVLGASLGQMMPIQGPGQAVFPGVSTAVQLGVDKDLYTGRAITSRWADEQASPISRGVASGINAGAAAIGRYPDVRPSQAEFATRNLGSGVAGAIHGAASTIAGEKRGSGLPQDVPVAGGLIGRFVGARTGGELDRAQKNALTPEHRHMLYEAGLRPDVGVVRADIDGAPLTRREAADYQTRANEYVADALDLVSGRPDWEEGSQSKRADLVSKAIERAHAQAKREMVVEIGRDVLVERAGGRTERREALGVR